MTERPVPARPGGGEPVALGVTATGVLAVSAPTTVQAHGATGSFVSRYVIEKGSLPVVSGEDQIKNLVTAGPKNLSRLCSADLPEKSAFFNSATGEGYDGRIFMNGEENAPTGRALGNVVENGTTYELPALGKAGWENLPANPATATRRPWSAKATAAVDRR